MNPIDLINQITTSHYRLMKLFNANYYEFVDETNKSWELNEDELWIEGEKYDRHGSVTHHKDWVCIPIEDCFEDNYNFILKKDLKVYDYLYLEDLESEQYDILEELGYTVDRLDGDEWLIKWG